MKIKHIFFDLDHTLWDFNKNAQETLSELYHELELGSFLPSFKEFYDQYIEVNEGLWDLYRNKEITKESLRTVRFVKTFQYFNIQNDSIANVLGNEYISRGPYKSNLFPFCSFS